MNRDKAWNILCEYTENESLRKHALCVEAAMRAYAEKQNADQDLYGITGLLHDFDYDRWPDEHPQKGNQILQDLGVSDDILTAIMGHAEYTNVTRESLLAKTLYAVDELSGFIVAVTLVKPDRSVLSVSPKSIKKKMKDKRFAAKVSRETIRNGISELEVDFDEHIEFVVKAISGIAGKIGLNP